MYILTGAAKKDVEKLLERSVIEFGIHQTEIYFNSLKDCLMLLAENPAMGYSADDIKSGYRRFTHESHVIFYHGHKNGILIVRVLHKAMDIGKQFDEVRESPALVYE